MSNLVGQQITHFQITALLGSGRLGPVYQAIDLEDPSTTVALKTVSLHLTRQPQFRQRFLEEVRAIPRLDHSSIVKIYEAGADTEQDLLYIAMENIAQGSLTSYLKQLAWRDEQMRLGEALEIAAQIADALGYIHQKGLLHRDIRPNIVLFRVDEKAPVVGGIHRRAIISGDLGLEAMLDEEAEPFEQLWPYLSPEQCLGKQLEARSDLYALGILLYQLATNHLPFEIKTLEEAVQQHAYETPPSPREYRPEMTTAVANAILKAIAKSPDQRYQTGSEMAKALRQLVAELPETLERAAADSIENVDTQVESDAMLAIQASQWNNDSDQVAITTDLPRTLNQRVVTIGRDENNDIVLPIMSITRRHAQLERTATGWQVRDLGSRNGTFLGGNALLPDIPEEWLTHQTLRIGPYFLHLQPGKGYAFKGSSFDVELLPTEMELVPGKPKQLNLTITNLGQLSEEYEIHVERLPLEWINLPVAPIRLKPGERRQIAIPLSVPLREDVLTGKIRYLLIVNSLSPVKPDKVAKPGILDVKSPEDAFSIDMSPSTLTQGKTAQLSIRNEGVKDITYTIKGHDPDDALKFSEWRWIQKEEITRKGTPASARPKSKPFWKQLPTVSYYLNKPKSMLIRAFRYPIVLLNRLLPGLGTMLGGSFDQQSTSWPKGDKDKAPEKAKQEDSFAKQQKDMRKVYFPDDLQTQIIVPSGQEKIVYLSAEPRKRPLMQTHAESVPFEISVGTTTSEQKRVSGQVDVLPRLRIRPAVLWVPVVLIFVCLLGATAVSFLNRTFANIALSSTDLDKDGLNNFEETYSFKTDPNRADTDGDGMSDGEEIQLGLDPRNADTDGDGLSDMAELQFNTNPLAFDTDGDSLADGLEIRTLATDPLQIDDLPVVRKPTPTNTPQPIATLLPTPQPTSTAAPTDRQELYNSQGFEDGHIVREGSITVAINNDAIIQVGDGNNNNRQYKGILSFDTSSLPNDVVVQSAQLRLNQDSRVGDPYSLGDIHIDIAPMDGFNSNPSLENEDFSANSLYTKVATLSRNETNGEWGEANLNANGLKAINPQGVTQFRLYFTLPNNNNGIEEWISFVSGDNSNTALHPQLLLYYTTTGN